MPYITKKRRDQLENGELDVSNLMIGDVNYMISSFLNEYIQVHGLSYAVINELIGVLECAKLELYARIARPYEDLKIEQNGDVYDDPNQVK